MRAFISGLLIGTGLGYMFHEDIDRALRQGVGKANEKFSESSELSEDDGSTRATFHNPANGTSLSPERKVEINNSSEDRPIVLTLEDIKAMSINHVRENVNAGRFQMPEGLS